MTAPATPLVAEETAAPGAERPHPWHGWRRTLLEWHKSQLPEPGDLVTADLHPSDSPEQQAGSTRQALDELIRGAGARPISSAEDVDRFRTELWHSDEELEEFLLDLRASRNAGI